MIALIFHLYVMLPILLVYFGTGLKVARNNYTELVRRHSAINKSYLLADKRREISAISHGPNCWRGTAYRSTTHDCDCSKSNQWKSLKRDIITLEGGQMPNSNPKYSTIALWPLGVVQSYVMGGAAALPNYDLIEQLERSELPSKG